jgi:uncharacterized protein YdeI (YjbR/CyaY-like superfamily)
MSEEKAGLPILAFADCWAFEAWLAAQPPGHAGLWVKFAKPSAQTASVGKSEAVDAALCHGWIDGQLETYDTDFWLTRFTPRKKASKWSQNNCKRALALIEAGRMRPAGLAEVEAAKADGRWDAAYPPQSKAEVPADLAAALAVNPAAERFFASLTGANRFAVLYRIADAKKPETRAARIAKFVEMLARGETIYPQKSQRAGAA